MMEPIIRDGKPLTKAHLAEVRESVIEWCDESLKQWPEAISFTLRASHLISILFDVIEQYPEVIDG